MSAKWQQYLLKTKRPIGIWIVVTYVCCTQLLGLAIATFLIFKFNLGDLPKESYNQVGLIYQWIGSFIITILSGIGVWFLISFRKIGYYIFVSIFLYILASVLYLSTSLTSLEFIEKYGTVSNYFSVAITGLICAYLNLLKDQKILK